MKRTSIQSPYFAAYYHRLMKRKNGFKKGMIRDRGEVLRLLSIIWKTVSEHYVEADAGVYVDNVGYLCHVLIPGQRFTVRRDLDIVSRLGTNGYLYNHLAMDFADSKRYYHFNLMRRKRRCGLSVIPMCAGKWEKSTPTWHEPCRKQVSSE